MPGNIQQLFPDYHGVVWYWTTFRLPRRPENGERILLRFGAVDYLAEVWVNGQSVGGHEGGETPFELDATAAIAGDAGNLLAVRVLNPADEPIDGIRLAETPHRNKLNWGYQPGWMHNHGGILRPVELRLAPPFRLDEVFVKADLASGRIDVETSIRNDSARTEAVGLELTVAAAGGGVPLAAVPLSVTVPPGSSTHRLTATNPMVPDAYRFPLKLAAGPQSVRVGFCRRGLGLHPALPPSRPPVDRRGTPPPADGAVLSIGDA